MTRTEFLRTLLEKGNRAGAYSLDEARSGGECLDSVKADLDALDKIVSEEASNKEANKTTPKK